MVLDPIKHVRRVKAYVNGKLPFCERCHSRPQRPRSFWSAPRIATSGPVQRHSVFEWLCKHNRLRSQPIRFVRLDSEQWQGDGKSVNRGLPVLVRLGQPNSELVQQVFGLFKTYLTSQLDENGKQLQKQSKIEKKPASSNPEEIESSSSLTRRLTRFSLILPARLIARTK